jgi:4'-phosphopantetheinyl transferase
MSIEPIPSVSRCQLWRVDLDAVAAPEAAACLSNEEWGRAHRFVFARDRRRFIAAHAALRSTLSARTGIPGAFLDFTLGANGKPALVYPPDVHFNLSHSQSVGLIAVGERDQIGVDVEVLRHMPDVDAMAAAYFTPAEQRALEATPPEERDRAFLCCWTRKEACLKAMGTGLGGVDTRSFEAGLGGDPREVRIHRDHMQVRIELVSFDGGPGIVCALARVVATETPSLVAPHLAAPQRELCA